MGSMIILKVAKNQCLALSLENTYLVADLTAQKMKFSIKDFSGKCDQIRSFFADLVTFTEEILNGKLHFLNSVSFDHNTKGLEMNILALNINCYRIP